MSIFDNKNDKKEIYLRQYPKNSNGYDCKSCAYFITSGNGNYECHFGEPNLVVKREIPTENYYWCCGKNYKRKYK